MSDNPEPERPMAEEHRWRSDGEEFRATDRRSWYRDGENWRFAAPDWIARYLRQELLRVVAERDAALRENLQWKALAGRQHEARGAVIDAMSGVLYLLSVHEAPAHIQSGLSELIAAEVAALECDPDGTAAARELEELRKVNRKLDTYRLAIIEYQADLKDAADSISDQRGRMSAMVERSRSAGCICEALSDAIDFFGESHTDGEGGYCVDVHDYRCPDALALALEEIAREPAPGAGEGRPEPRPVTVVDAAHALGVLKALSAKWQPMEMAPRDDTRILVDFGRIGVHAVSWTLPQSWGDDSPRLWCVDDRKHGPFPLRGYIETDIKGWMPLPAPAAPGQQEPPEPERQP